MIVRNSMLLFQSLISQSEIELCTTYYELPESILCIYVSNTGQKTQAEVVTGQENKNKNTAFKKNYAKTMKDLRRRQSWDSRRTVVT